MKLRVAESQQDYVEVEVDERELTYNGLMYRCTQELGINGNDIERMRKMPDTKIRQDEDLRRFNTFESIEVVMKKKVKL